MKKALNFAHHVILEKIDKNSICVDMTVGNGNDTLLLCQNGKFVYGFDIQQVAIDNTNSLLKRHGLSNYQLICDNHCNLKEHLNENIDLFVYNLGYLPCGDKSITTTYDFTIKSLMQALELLNKNGLILLMVYSGHEEGKIEAKEVEKFVSNLPQNEYEVLKYGFINQINNPPYLIVIERK